MSPVVAGVLAAGAVLALMAPAPGRRHPRRVATPCLLHLPLVSIVVARWQQRRDHDAFELALPAFLEAAAGHLRAGSSLRAAIVDAAPAASDRVAPAFAPLAASAAAGDPLGPAVDAWARGRPETSTPLAAAALGLAAAEGGAAARSLDAVAATLRDRQALKREVQASSAQARLSAAVVGSAPIVFAVLASSLDPRVLVFLCTTPVGLGCLVCGVALDAVGLWWMRRIVAGVAL